MGQTFLWMIRLYWRVAPASLRSRCLFRITCSHHVYEATRKSGLRAGLWSLRQRWRQCRPGYRVELCDGRLQVVLRNGAIVGAEDVSDGILSPYRDALFRAEEGVRRRLQGAE